MLPFAHFMAGGIFHYLIKKDKRRLFSFLFLGLIGILPDFDSLLAGFVFKDWHWIVHRGITHSIPVALISGLITLVVLKNFWVGALAHLSHFFLDYIDLGYVYLFPWGPIVRGNWLVGIDQVVSSSIVGTSLLFIIIAVEFWKERKTVDIYTGPK